MSVEQLVRKIERRDKISCSVVKDDLGVIRIFREVGVKNDPLFDDGWNRVYAPGGYMPKENLPQESPPVQKSRIRNPRHGNIKL